MTEGTNIQNTEYLDGFQYTQEALDFFPHKEGYVKVVSAQGVGGSSSFNYVFSYTDHLGNIRLRYTKTETQGLAILEENHYYPFGLKHNGYNSDHKIFEFNDGTNTVVLTPVTPSRKETYKYKFQGTELQTELGLNWNFFKFRTYDPAIGRFLQIDPLAPTYVYNSTYAFAENNVTSGIDLEGLELSFEMDGNRATGVKRSASPVYVQKTYTLQEVRSEMAKQQTQREALQNRIDALPAAKSNQSRIDYPTTHINRAKYAYPQSGLMLADGVGVGAKEAVTDIALGGALYGLYRGARALGSSVWDMGKFARGRTIENMLGANQSWAKNFPTIDKIENGVATSIKSMDLNAKSYQKGNSVFNTLKGYVDKLDNFTSQSWAGVDVVQGESYTSKTLELAVQTGKGTESQWSQIGDAIQYAMDREINVTIKFID